MRNLRYNCFSLHTSWKKLILELFALSRISLVCTSLSIFVTYFALMTTVLHLSKLVEQLNILRAKTMFLMNLFYFDE